MPKTPQAGLPGRLRRFVSRPPDPSFRASLVVLVGGRLYQIPQVSVEVLEDRDGAVGLGPGFPDENHPPVCVGVEVPPEVVGVQEQENPSSGLVADMRLLGVVGRTRQQQAGLCCSGRRHHDPALAWLRKVGVLNQQEAERADIERNGLIVIPNDNRDESEVLRHGSLC